jgi:hypothetical protein
VLQLKIYLAEVLCLVGVNQYRYFVFLFYLARAVHKFYLVFLQPGQLTDADHCEVTGALIDVYLKEHLYNFPTIVA